MPKRKRGEEHTSTSDVVRTSGRTSRTHHAQAAQVDGAIGNGKKSLFKALKTARGFERQKLGRRQKTASEANLEDDVKRLATEVAALKSLDLAATAETHLYKSLLKTKSIASSSALPSYVVLKNNASNDAHSAAQRNVTARLYNSNPVKVVMAEVMGTIRKAMAIQIPNRPRNVKQKKISFETRNVSDTAEQSAGLSELEAPEPGSDLTLHDDHESSSDIELEGHEDYSGRLANSTTEDDLSADEMKGTIPAGKSTTRLRQSSFSPVRSPSPRLAASKSPNRNKSSQAMKSTTFLPSLTLGGYLSNSDSAGSDSDSRAANVTTRKNRMGQQARRQLWEKKFGHKANHIKKQGRDQGWDLKKGAQGGDERGSRARGRGGYRNVTSGSRPRKIVQGASGANSDPLGPRREKPGKADKVDGPLHPSWVAAKKLKEGKKALAFEGKKIVFD
ncbi:hypothetical protein MMC26_001642 [Xylographa opegraphella]|nr:hypothetical protein [Xylographa opegraphella]